MEYLLNNKVSDFVFYNEVTVAFAIVFIVLLIVIFFMYRILYDQAKGSHILPLTKVAIIGTAVTSGILYLSKIRDTVPIGSTYDDIENTDFKYI